MPPEPLVCSTVWGGTRNIDTEIASAGIRASVYSHAADGSRGGDIYYMSLCGADKLTRMAIADVVGHGEAVSQVSKWVYEALLSRVNALDGNSVLSELNALAGGKTTQAMTTAAVVAYYRNTNRLYLSFAGHPPVLVRRRLDDGWWRAEMTPNITTGSNLPLGVLDDTTYEQHEVELEQGDMVFLHTDGVLEARSPKGELFGQERLFDTLTRVSKWEPEATKRAVLEELHGFTGGALGHDDVTLIAAQVR